MVGVSKFFFLSYTFSSPPGGELNPCIHNMFLCDIVVRVVLLAILRSLNVSVFLLNQLHDLRFCRGMLLSSRKFIMIIVIFEYVIRCLMSYIAFDFLVLGLTSWSLV